MYRLLDALGLTTAALDELWALLWAVTAALLVMPGTMLLAGWLAGLRTRSQVLGVLIVTAWAGLVGLAWPFCNNSLLACRIDDLANPAYPFLAVIAVYIRSLLGFRRGWRLALGLTLAAVISLVLSVIAAGTAYNLLYPM